MVTLQTANHSFVPAEWDGQNHSGIQPIGDQVLILPDKASEKMGKQGSLYIPESVKKQGDHAVEAGVIVAIGEGAFYWAHDRVREYIGLKPKVGDRAVFGRYMGGEKIGNDGETYRIMTDKCIGGIHHLPEAKETK